MSRHVERGRQTPRKSALSGRLVIGVVVLALIIAGVAIFLAQQPGASGPVSDAAYAGLQADGLALGPASAPVTVVEYSDFQCPFCKRAESELVAPLKEQFVRNGTVRFEYRPIAILGSESVRASEAGLCAKDQGKFWLYHDKLFASQAGENGGAFSDANLKRFAAEIGLDRDAFANCLDGNVHRREVQALNDEAQGRGVTGTPTFFVNNQKIDGVVPFSQLREAIDAAH